MTIGIGFKCIGNGIPVANSVIVPLLPPSPLTPNEAARVGFYTLSQVKIFVDGCGGQTEMVTFREGKGKFGHIPHMPDGYKFFEELYSIWSNTRLASKIGSVLERLGMAPSWKNGMTEVREKSHSEIQTDPRP